MASAQSEPSMDEILASIRRIISEDEESQPAARKTASRLETLTLDDDMTDDEDDLSSDDELEASHDGDAEDEFSVEDSLDDFSDEEEGAEMAAETSEYEPETAPQPKDNAMAKSAVAEELTESRVAAALSSANVGSLISDDVQEKVANTFGSFEQNVRISSGSSRTMEDIVEAMLAPMVKQWLDANLPRIVEEKVEEEVRRIARRRG
ncbi:DUF2497 domain-containing protein [Parvularcula sp. LCG005]|uniref:DUF2497 domain-containing protein n=1 Tax=Parvularcula sp. LCG005 TaxID=3078805 RepID=UPI0029431887|nr:DUF2497 domain-containing protein [Parvularcula sp. LCG005]WOI52384.1 DUF2497 domain-containing protein [Parvularcula sp. LCG005]